MCCDTFEEIKNTDRFMITYVYATRSSGLPKTIVYRVDRVELTEKRWEFTGHLTTRQITDLFNYKGDKK